MATNLNLLRVLSFQNFSESEARNKAAAEQLYKQLS